MEKNFCRNYYGEKCMTLDSSEFVPGVDDKTVFVSLTFDNDGNSTYVQLDSFDSNGKTVITDAEYVDLLERKALCKDKEYIIIPNDYKTGND